MPPFAFTREDLPTADFILHTSDNVFLYVHRAILELASPFFKDMLSLPQPNLNWAFSDENIVMITDTADIVRQLLSLIYPLTSFSRPSAGMMTLKELYELIRVSLKYQFESATETLTEMIITKATNDPRDAPTVYVIGCVLNSNELIRAASGACLKLGHSDLLDSFPENHIDESPKPETSPSSPSMGSLRPPQNPTYYPGPAAKREGVFLLRELLNIISPWDYQRLVRFHHRRLSEAKTIIESNLYAPYNKDCLKMPRSCLDVIFDLINTGTIRELERNGPNSESLVNEGTLEHCLGLCVDACSSCLKMVSLFEIRESIDTIRSEILSLPQSCI